eukprot:TRINITY_DN9528_c0_g1_i2.p1 TRINITY_DN9528_c0_g1~~TRINITY_DN9528_c0_g1_i2.p1  ORF type:complete len:295 (+),score=53.93 TRINITY_DN9528_c0_g1_i2:83-967(+)
MSQEQTAATEGCKEAKLPTRSTIDAKKLGPCIMGIDEAGRGPVLGPMVYGCCFCPKERADELKGIGFADSKTLTEQERDNFFETITQSDFIGWKVTVIQARDLSSNMLKKCKYNLNQISHDAAIDLIRYALAEGADIQAVYLDTVGDVNTYQDKLKKLFPDIEIKVSKKADSIYPVVSAASICAKVTRDYVLKNWKFEESGIKIDDNFGSGYPSDPATVRWLQGNIDPVFGFPSLIRFSWQTCDRILEKDCVSVTWPHQDDEKDSKIRVATLFESRQKRAKFFDARGMAVVQDF